jgi:hypothetical protein
VLWIRPGPKPLWRLKRGAREAAKVIGLDTTKHVTDLLGADAAALQPLDCGEEARAVHLLSSGER